MTATITPDLAGRVRNAGSSSALHGDDRVWPETNCYTDLWIELLHRLGHDPAPALGALVAADVVAGQWSMVKPAPGDLVRLHGLDVAEINVWRRPIDHVGELLAAGCLATVEVDAWWLPDTAGLSYRRAHDKTTIAPINLDAAGRVLEYLHGGGRHRLDGDDFDGCFTVAALPPYVEVVRRQPGWTPPAEPGAEVLALLRGHLGRRPVDNPVERLGAVVADALPTLRAADDERTLHAFLFTTCRQAGATAELLASYFSWIGSHQPAVGAPADAAAKGFLRCAEACKALQFTVARAAHGREARLADTVADAAGGWSDGQVAAERCSR